MGRERKGRERRECRKGRERRRRGRGRGGGGGGRERIGSVEKGGREGEG